MRATPVRYEQLVAIFDFRFFRFGIFPYRLATIFFVELVLNPNLKNIYKISGVVSTCLFRADRKQGGGILTIDPTDVKTIHNFIIRNREFLYFNKVLSKGDLHFFVCITLKITECIPSFNGEIVIIDTDWVSPLIAYPPLLGLILS